MILLIFMVIRFYNTLSRKKEEFKPIKKNKVKIYSCGPTIYNFVHIGNLRAYVFTDILIKTLKYLKYDVLSVMNLTDVDDKTIRNSKKLITDENKNPNDALKQFTSIYEKAFYKDIESMNIAKTDIIPKATDSIKEMEFIIQKLFNKGYAYESKDGIYFDISKYKEYGKLINLNLKEQKYNKKNRVVTDEYEKDNLQDFALWKLKKDNEPSWTIKINDKEYIGRPGWHIECSAMSYKFLGEIFDIHIGGVDLKFPHHENEVAQSSCAFGHNSQSNYWMHNEHLLVDNKKMSKSLGNFYTLRDLIDKGYDPLALREVFFRSHYKQQLNFSFESLDSGVVNVKKINDFYSKLKITKPSEIIKNKIKEVYKDKIKQFKEALEDDLNTPNAISVIYEFMNEFNKLKEYSKEDLNLGIKFMEETNQVVGLLKIQEEIPLEVLDLAKQRKEVRDNKNWEESDKLRNEIKELGYTIKDDKNAKNGFILTSN